ncbi:MAG: acyl-CoA dehydrogenase family protein [Novosphingobium sp.]
MNFELSEDEAMLKALAERFVIDRYDNERRRGYLAQSNGFDPHNWSMLGELGLIAALFDEAAGGLALDATGIATVFEALGRGMVAEPLIENVLVAARLFAGTAPADLRQKWLDGLLSGQRRLALAHAESGGRNGQLWVETRADANGAGLRLSGSKLCVPAGSGVDGFLVSARSNGSPADPQGVGLYFVPANSPGLTIESWKMADGSCAVTLHLDGVATAVKLDGDAAAIEHAQDLANLARAAEALGIMEQIFADTLEYLRTREQFGTKLGSFQALQHRMVAQYAVIEQTRALLNLAQVSCGKAEFASAVNGVRAYVAQTSLTLGHEMIQMHGGMGVTDELSIGHGHKRLLVLSRWPDDPEAALDRFAGIA